jgi:hypothetical protein
VSRARYLIKLCCKAPEKIGRIFWNQYLEVDRGFCFGSCNKRRMIASTTASPNFLATHLSNGQRQYSPPDTLVRQNTMLFGLRCCAGVCTHQIRTLDPLRPSSVVGPPSMPTVVYVCRPKEACCYHTRHESMVTTGWFIHHLPHNEHAHAAAIVAQGGCESCLVTEPSSQPDMEHWNASLRSLCEFLLTA